MRLFHLISITFASLTCNTCNSVINIPVCVLISIFISYSNSLSKLSLATINGDIQACVRVKVVSFHRKRLVALMPIINIYKHPALALKN